MRSTFKLLNSYFWKTFYGPILAFVFPVILLGILGNIFRVEYVYPGILAMSFLFIGILSLPLAIMELKQSSLFKYIGSSPVNPIKFSIVVILFYMFISILSALIILIATMSLFYDKVFPNIGFKMGILGGIFTTWRGAVSFYTSTGTHLIFTIAIGLLLSTITKTPQQALTAGIIIIIPSMFLSGMILSVDIIGQSPVLNWISRFIPFRYSTGNIVIASTPLDQVGDMFQRLSHDQKDVLFKNISGDGSVIFTDFDTHDRVVHNMKELFQVRQDLGQNVNNSIKDLSLFNLTFGKALDSNAASSDNNMFDWIESWSVRRIPQVDKIQQFITEYFATFSSNNGGTSDWSRLTPLADQIAQGKFGWLEIFMKQTNTLYSIPDRVLNFLIPVSGTIGILWYVKNNFRWSSR